MSEKGVYKVLIRESHIDTLGHVNNATYLALFEEARWELITQRGYGINELRKFQKGPVILDLNLRFLKELRLREEIEITTEIVKYEGRVGQMLQKMVKKDGVVASELLMNFGLFDLQERKLISPTAEWKNAMGME